MQRRFAQVDVFTETAYRGNPLAVVHDADGLSDAEMQRFANWTNLSETTFLLPPTVAAADYRVRIFTTYGELAFAGHPTLGTCHSWLEAGGVPQRTGVIVQECAAGLVDVRDDSERLAFAAPPLLRSGPIEPALLDEIAAVLRIDAAAIVDSAWVDNGPGWVAVLLDTAAAVLAIQPADTPLKIGVVGPHPPGAPADVEVRAFFPNNGGSTAEDPVTGSLNASVAQWLLGSGRLSAPYVASQGTVLGRAGRVRIERDDNGTIWVGGSTITCISGTVEI
ncbi:MAG TPA: PhzF family phenazine biosynthesis protein [Ilumatobacteraceae bacterium]